MATTQYVGSRYVPLLADPVEWSSTKEYEPLTIVTHEGNSYTSRQFVPVGVSIDNTDFWAPTGNYNAQVEQYRRDVHNLGLIIPASEFTQDATVKKYIDGKAMTLPNVEAMTNSSDIQDGAYVVTQGFYEPNDGGGAAYAIKATGETDGMFVLECSNSLYAHLLVNNFITPNQLGAKGNAVTDDTAYLVACIASGYPIFLKAMYAIKQTVIFANNYVIGCGEDSGLVFSDQLGECVSIASGSHFIFRDFKIQNEYGISLQLRTADIENSIIENVTIVNARTYGMLINSGVVNGRNLIIANNIVETPGIAIEANTTQDAAIQNISIINNRTKTLGNDRVSTGISIAHGNNVYISGNFCNGVEYEGIHIEDGSEQTIVDSNVIDDCRGHGIVAYGWWNRNTYRTKLTNNLLRFADGHDNTGKIGIFNSYSPQGTYRELDISGNKIYGFDYGFAMSQGCELVIADNCEIQSCNVMCRGRFATNTLGHISLIDTPKIGEIIEPAGAPRNIFVEDVSMGDIDLDDFLIVSGCTARFNKLAYSLSGLTVEGTATHKFNLLKLPTAFYGIINVYLSGGNNRASITARVEHNSDTSNVVVLARAGYGVASSPNILIENGYIVLGCYCGGQTYKATVKIDGEIIFTEYNAE